MRIPVQYVCQDQGNTKGATLSKDISRDGLGLILTECLPVGAPLTLDLKLSESPSSTMAQGEVAWQYELQNSGGIHTTRFATGLHFTEISQDARTQIEHLVLDSLKQRSEDDNATISSLLERKSTLTQRQFTFPKRVFLKDTNAEGNVYFAHFFEWQGEAREEFFRQHVPDHAQLLQSGIQLITVNAWITFKRFAYLFEEILIDVKTAHLKKFSLELVFTFIHKATGKVVAEGGQKLAFSDPNGATLPIPASIRANARYFLIDSTSASSEVSEKIRRSKIE
jgi:YbgC/YbaW family acyl-CoA thioester hydrolase